VHRPGRPTLEKIFIDLLKEAQHRDLCMVQEFRDMPYDERLKSLDWCTLEERRLWGDMIQVFKLINLIHFFISHLLILEVIIKVIQI